MLKQQQENQLHFAKGGGTAKWCIHCFQLAEPWILQNGFHGIDTYSHSFVFIHVMSTVFASICTFVSLFSHMPRHVLNTFDRMGV